MKYISIFLLLIFVFVPDMFASGYTASSHATVVSHTEGFLKIVFVLMKIIGFLILIFSLADLISVSNGKTAGDRSFSAAAKIMLSGTFMLSDKIYSFVKEFK